MAFVAKEAKKNELEAKVMAGVEGWKVSSPFFALIVCLCVFTAPTICSCVLLGCLCVLIGYLCVSATHIGCLCGLNHLGCLWVLHIGCLWVLTTAPHHTTILAQTRYSRACTLPGWRERVQHVEAVCQAHGQRPHVVDPRSREGLAEGGASER